MRRVPSHLPLQLHHLLVQSQAFPWRCPTCKKSYNTVAQAKCWCGKMYSDDIENEGNCGGQLCGKSRACSSLGKNCVSICAKPCHQGPCDPLKCLNACDMMKAPEPIITRMDGNWRPLLHPGAGHRFQNKITERWKRKLRLN